MGRKSSGFSIAVRSGRAGKAPVGLLSSRTSAGRCPMTRESASAAGRIGLWLVAIALSSGCVHLGPRTIAVDRFDYSSAVADSWKQQTLLNIVKLRYMDLPVFVDVASIVSGYSLQTGVNVGGTLSSKDAIQRNFLAAGAQAIYTDRPTITYVPM